MSELLSTFLFATPSWSNGAARAFDIAGVYDEYNRAGTTEQVDALMLCLDWLVVGGDLRAAIQEVVGQALPCDRSLPVH